MNTTETQTGISETPTYEECYDAYVKRVGRCTIMLPIGSGIEAVRQLCISTLTSRLAEREREIADLQKSLAGEVAKGGQELMTRTAVNAYYRYLKTGIEDTQRAVDAHVAALTGKNTALEKACGEMRSALEGAERELRFTPVSKRRQGNKRGEVIQACQQALSTARAKVDEIGDFARKTLALPTTETETTK